MSVLWTSGDIAAATSGACKGTWTVNGVSIDSRTVKKGDLFVALKGPNFDAHDFVADALKKGAGGALVSHIPPRTPSEKLVLVNDTFKALEDLGRASRARSKAKVIAVTGSVGKTGCKEALRQVLSVQKASFASTGSYNNHWGVPLSLSQMPQATAYGIFELGMNHAGELGPLSKMARPHIALITGIAAVHLGHFASLEEIARAKAEIFEGLEADGTAVLNGDDAYYNVLKDCAVKTGVKNIARFGKGADFEARLEEFSLNDESSTVHASILGKKLNYAIGAPGEHWVMNSLAVLLCAALAGADVQRAAESFKDLKLATGRGGTEHINFVGGAFTLIDESYNASPVAVEAAIRVLGRRKPEGDGRRILVLGDMKELGDQSQKLHEALAAPIQEAGIAKVYATGEHMRCLLEALPESLRGGWRATSSELAPQVAENIRHGDVVT
ncbi:MAG TPA: UDP-N-acetylmuramoyl-tripeptide--D-alanyl-D-alanine ligase, partial [Alphaproteobacteria bacterium]|nr:UDP-N-acetylmuramoyl-tripeptide--D-alanyl-D-alanine ligase [Alphaproteobacteria bacterium]